jgi:hypothetical protein
MAKVEIPDSLKADLPATRWGKLIGATPVVLTVVATLLAGLSNGEMTRAQYDRGLAAQQQSKAGDQWGYFQAKKLRGAMQRSTLDMLHATLAPRPLTAADVGSADREVQHALLTGEPPTPPPAPPIEDNLHAALVALETGQPEEQVTALLAQVKEATLAAALLAARERANAFDAALKPVSSGIDAIEQRQAIGSQEIARAVTAARLKFAANRYETEAKLNQTIATILELQVRKTNSSAERHHARSQRFFYGMLAAQLGVILSTLAMAAQRKNFLWTVAAVAGLTAVAFAGYVYFYS